MKYSEQDKWEWDISDHDWLSSADNDTYVKFETVNTSDTTHKNTYTTHKGYMGPLLLTWFNFNPSMDK